MKASSLEQVQVIETPFGKGGKTHGMYGTRFYNCYRSMLQRCNDPNATSYPRYGGIGTKCLWKTFEDFKRDMYESYLAHVKEFGERQTTIDRINSRGHYHKENCRWATYLEQARNKRDNTLLTFKGKTLTIGAWAEELGMSPQTISTRHQRGWAVERILNPQRQNRYGKLLFFEYQGQRKSLKEWAKFLGIKYPTLYWRIILNKMPVEQAFQK